MGAGRGQDRTRPRSSLSPNGGGGQVEQAPGTRGERPAQSLRLESGPTAGAGTNGRADAAVQWASRGPRAAPGVTGSRGKGRWRGPVPARAAKRKPYRRLGRMDFVSRFTTLPLLPRSVPIQPARQSVLLRACVGTSTVAVAALIAAIMLDAGKPRTLSAANSPAHQAQSLPRAKSRCRKVWPASEVDDAVIIWRGGAA